MSSEIGNKSLLRSFASYLNILDVKQFPSRLKTDEVVAVVDISNNSSTTPMPAFNEYELVDFSTSVPLDGLAEYNVNLITGNGTHDQRLLAFGFNMTNSFNETIDQMNIRLELVAGEEGFPVADYYPWDTTSVAKKRFALWGNSQLGNVVVAGAKPASCSWNGFVPADANLYFRIETTSVLWPTGCTLEWFCLSAKVTKGRLTL